MIGSSLSTNITFIVSLQAPNPILIWNGGVKAQHRKKLTNSIEKGCTQQIDTKYNERIYSLPNKWLH